MKKGSRHNKIRLRVPEEGAYSIIYNRINSIRKTNLEIIKFSDIFSKLCVSLQIDKKHCWELLFYLNDIGMLSIVRNKGIILNDFVCYDK